MGRYDPKKVSPRIAAKIEKFQRMFVGYFPHLEDIERAATEWNWLHVKFFINPIDTVRRSKAKAELQRVAKALRVLIHHEMPYWGPLSWSLKEAAAEAKKSGNKELQEIVEWEEELFTFILELSELREERTPYLASAVDKFVLDAERAIDRVPDTANVNWNAVHAVEALRWLWWRNTDGDAPSRALNPASTFYSYLKDGFDFLEVAADPASAFKRWAARRPYDEDGELRDEVV